MNTGFFDDALLKIDRAIQKSAPSWLRRIYTRKKYNLAPRPEGDPFAEIRTEQDLDAFVSRITAFAAQQNLSMRDQAVSLIRLLSLYLYRRCNSCDWSLTSLIALLRCCRFNDVFNERGEPCTTFNFMMEDCSDAPDLTAAYEDFLESVYGISSWFYNGTVEECLLIISKFREQPDKP